MKCCAACFGDAGLRRSIIPSRSTEVGRCSYCGTEGMVILAPAQLVDNFELLISAYQPDEAGKTLVEWFREDWGMFDHPNMDQIRTNDLLADILGDEEIVRKNYSPASRSGVGQLAEWEKLRDELMYRNRYFPETDIDYKGFEVWLSQLISDSADIPQRWYRARIQTGDLMLPITEMGAPPKRIASYGRANPAGIPYLYLGSTELTAISEIRPHTGEVVCVAEFTTTNDLKLVDLRKPKKMVSPFLLADAEEIGRMRGDIPFLERVGDELTRPVVPFAAAIDYTPSQYICEFIKKCGYQGVIYRSSVSDGINLALFDPSNAATGAVRQHRISRITVQIE